MGSVYDEFPCGLGSQPLGEMLDAANECAHGRLPGDPSLPCGCWTEGVVHWVDRDEREAA